MRTHQLPGWEGVEMSAVPFTIRQLKRIVNELPEAALDCGIAVCQFDGSLVPVVNSYLEKDGRTITEPCLIISGDNVPEVGQ